MLSAMFLSGRNDHLLVMMDAGFATTDFGCLLPENILRDLQVFSMLPNLPGFMSYITRIVLFISFLFVDYFHY